MAAELVFAEEAEHDISDAYAYYERQRIGLGEDFLTRLDARIQTLRRSPKALAPYYQDYRRALLRKYPYAVYYLYDDADDRVTVYGIFHTSRDPQKIIDRLSG
jgi:plasmid stabilization system protein ParE